MTVLAHMIDPKGGKVDLTSTSSSGGWNTPTGLAAELLCIVLCQLGVDPKDLASHSKGAGPS